MNKHFQPAPKPEAPERGTRLAKQYMTLVAQLPCICAGTYGVSLHHCIHNRGAQRRSSDFDVIPLSHDYHQGNRGVHTLPKWWKANFGLDTSYIIPTRNRVRDLIGRSIGGEYAELLAKLDQLEREE